VPRKAVLGLCIVIGVCLTSSAFVHAQQSRKIVQLGILCGVRCEGAGYDALKDGLRGLGWIEGQNLAIQRRGAGGQQERLPALATELVALKPDVIVAVGPQPTRAAKDAAGSIPVVMVGVADPVGVGLVHDLARPGGTITGFTTLIPGGFGGKQLALLKELLPAATRMAVLRNPKNDVAMRIFPGDVPPAAERLGINLHVIDVSSANEIEGAIDTAARERVEGLLVFGDPMFHTPPGRLPELAARARLPAIYLVREVTQAGGLISYGPDFNDMFRRAARYIDRILKGERPGDLPIQQPAKFELVINLHTARMLGLTIPQSLLQRADAVLE
jgi:putative ABC transport system substrate-binding protein